jgi:hypothetical protein
VHHDRIEDASIEAPLELSHGFAPDAPDREGHPLEEIAKSHVDRRMDSLIPRLEAMLEQLVQERFGDGGEGLLYREIRPGVRVFIDPSRVDDPEAVMSRILRAIADED